MISFEFLDDGRAGDLDDHLLPKLVLLLEEIPVEPTQPVLTPCMGQMAYL
jgi:hypothetical protein